jgi:V-type H+-transporting ATPase subunit D
MDRLQVISTRMNLKINETKLKGVQKGFSLLKCKSDALQIKLKELEKSIEILDEKMNFLFKLAYSHLSKGELVGCDWSIFSKICLENETKLSVNFDQICGVPLLKFNLEKIEFKKEILWKGGHLLKEIKTVFDDLISLLIEVSSQKNSLNAIKTAFEITNKRKNSLEHKMIPRLENTVMYIESELDEMEREEFYRLKKIQTKKK